MNRIAVYGSLRKGMYNHDLLKDAKYIGKYFTKPAYNMYAISSYPGIKLGGGTSVTMEVYEVDDATLDAVNALEGYTPGSKGNDFYNRLSVNTPYGIAYTYIYIPAIRSNHEKVISGDWVQFITEEVAFKNLLQDAQIF
jgi:gamma-glutamylcyclotransferase (GGCT)/AIG2-like uncharacterized protein YtfP